MNCNGGDRFSLLKKPCHNNYIREFLHEEKHKHAPGILIALMACHSRLHKLENLARKEDLAGDGDKPTKFLGYFKSFGLQNVY